MSLAARPTVGLNPAGLPYAVLIIALGILYWRSAPRLARVRFVGPEENVDYPLEAATPPVEPRSPLEEDTSVEESAGGEPAPEPAARAESPPDDPALTEATPALTGGAESTAWICPACHEENPAEFLICWKCQGPHPGFTLAPSSSSAADEDDPAQPTDEVSPPAPRP